VINQAGNQYRQGEEVVDLELPQVGDRGDEGGTEYDVNGQGEWLAHGVELL
jgi:hypothetical protein